MIYKDRLIDAMELLAQEPNVVFLGQQADDYYKTMTKVPKDKIIDFPIAEDLQMGICTGLALEGWLPICMFTRMDFMLLALNQLINHLDKIESMSHGQFKPKVVIRTLIGETKPLHPGPQHTQDFSSILRDHLKNIDVFDLFYLGDIMPRYERALENNKSSILIEYKDNYNNEE